MGNMIIPIITNLLFVSFTHGQTGGYGSPCSTTGACNYGLYCLWDSQNGYICRYNDANTGQTGGYGSRCSTTGGTCNYGLYCLWDFNQNDYICKYNDANTGQTGGYGSRCSTIGGTCDYGLYCLWDYNQNDYICRYNDANTGTNYYNGGGYGSSCTTNFDCTRNNQFITNIECINNVCQCRPDYDFINNNCVRVPQLGENCENTHNCLQRYSECTLQSGSNTYICECLPGYNRVNNECVFRNVALGGACSNHADCGTAYSVCTSGTCSCMNGFAANNGSTGCNVPAATCIQGSPYKEGTNTNNFVCERRRQTGLDYPNYAYSPAKEVEGNRTKRQATMTYGPEYFTDDCPSNYYCVPFNEDEYQMGDYVAVQNGFCCPDITPKCLIGNPHPSSSSPNYGCDECPLSTHYCLKGSCSSIKDICCPRPCSSPDTVRVGTNCYPKAKVGDRCEVSEQCAATQDAVCREFETGVRECACRDSNMIDLNGVCAYPICSNGGVFQRDGTRILRCDTANGPYITDNRLRVDSCASGFQCDSDYGVCCTTDNEIVI